MKIVLKIEHQIVYVSSKEFCSISKNGFFMADLVNFLDNELQNISINMTLTMFTGRLGLELYTEL